METSMDRFLDSREDLRNKMGEEISITSYVLKAPAKALEDVSHRT
jgi:hypothetical protein